MEEFGDEFEAGMGAEAFKQLLGKISILKKKLDQRLREEIPQTNSETKIKKLIQASESFWKRLLTLATSLSG